MLGKKIQCGILWYISVDGVYESHMHLRFKKWSALCDVFYFKTKNELVFLLYDKSLF